jgi:CubicO group peptidase (beta-lactamase class C family)
VLPKLAACLCLGLLLACDREADGLAPPSYPTPVAGNKANYDDVDWAARRSRIAAWMPEVEILSRDTFARQQLPSLVAGVLVDGQLIWWQGFGTRDLEEGGPVDAHTQYRVGSITQVVTAMAILRLRDDGKLSLDTPAASYVAELAELAYPTDDSPPITLRHLLTHTAGLPQHGKLDYHGERTSPVTERELCEGVRGLPVDRAPGLESVYSELGYALLGLIVARVAGGAYSDYVDEHILVPMGLGPGAWSSAAVPRDRLATGYAFEGGQYFPRAEWLFGAAEGAGGLYASLDQLARLLAYQMTVWPAGGRKSQPPLHNATLRESQRVGGFQRPDGTGAGFGWITASGPTGTPLVFSDGASAQHAAMVVFAPDDRVGVIALTNTGKPGTVGPLAHGILKLILERLGGAAPSAPRPKRPTIRR